jgi:hypothetical protein
MIAASSLAFPGSKTLASWWGQLASFNPQALWVGHLFLHRLEVLADMIQPEKPDPLSRLVLQALSLDQNHAPVSPPLTLPHNWLEKLASRLHLEAGVIQRLVQNLKSEDLLNHQAGLTAKGLQVLEQGHFSRRGWLRRELVFVERPRPDGQRLALPHFLPLAGGSGPPWHPDDKSRFQLDWLFACLQEPPEWKERFQFSQEVFRIANPAERNDDPPDWQRVVVDRPERLLVALIATGPDRQLLGFAARQEGWELHTRHPVLALPWEGREIFPDVRDLPSLGQWSETWKAWCKIRGIAPGEIQECHLNLVQGKVEITMPKVLRSRLETSKPDVFKEETWWLAGEGYLRPAAQVHFEFV